MTTDLETRLESALPPVDLSDDQRRRILESATAEIPLVQALRAEPLKLTFKVDAAEFEKAMNRLSPNLSAIDFAHSPDSTVFSRIANTVSGIAIMDIVTITAKAFDVSAAEIGREMAPGLARVLRALLPDIGYLSRFDWRIPGRKGKRRHNWAKRRAKCKAGKWGRK